MIENVRLVEVFKPLWRPDSSGLPKYQRLTNVMLAALKRGFWRPGDRLPAEQELVELTRFSLGTVQRALSTLVDQGVLVRRHGLGSFIAERPRRIQDPGFCRFLDDDCANVLPIYSALVRREMVEGEGSWTPFLGSDGPIMQLDRIVTVNDEFKLYSRFFADRLLLKRLWETPMRRLNGANFTQMISNECHLPIREIVHLVRIERFDAEICEVIEVEQGAAGLFVQTIGKAGRDLCVYYQEFCIPATSRPLQFSEQTTFGPEGVR